MRSERRSAASPGSSSTGAAGRGDRSASSSAGSFCASTYACWETRPLAHLPARSAPVTTATDIADRLAPPRAASRQRALGACPSSTAS